MIAPTLNRVATVAPAVYAQMQRTEAELEEAMASAVQQANAIDETVRQIERQAVTLAKHRFNTEQFRAEVCEFDADRAGNQALDAYFLSAESPCPLHSSSWDVARQRFAELKALQPFALKRLKAREAQAADMLATLKTDAKAAGIDLATLLGTMRTAADPRNGDQAARLHTLFAGGYFAID